MKKRLSDILNNVSKARGRKRHSQDRPLGTEDDKPLNPYDDIDAVPEDVPLEEDGVLDDGTSRRPPVVNINNVEVFEHVERVGRFANILDGLPIVKELRYRLDKEPLRKVADWLHERGYFTDIENAVLVGRLLEYKKWRKREIVKEVAIRDHESAYIDAVEKIDELNELGWLYIKHKERIQKRLEQENADEPDIDLKGEIALGVKILTERHKIKMDLGIGLSKTEGDFKISAFKAADDDTAKITQALQDPERLSRVHGVLVKILSAAEQDLEKK